MAGIEGHPRLRSFRVRYLVPTKRSKKTLSFSKLSRNAALPDLNAVHCSALPLAYAAVPEQDTQRIGFGACSQQHGYYHSWGRSIEGLTLQMDMVTKKILKVADTEIVPVPNGAVNYEETPEKARPGTAPIAISQPMGVNLVRLRMAKFTVAELALPLPRRPARRPGAEPGSIRRWRPHPLCDVRRFSVRAVCSIHGSIKRLE